MYTITILDVMGDHTVAASDEPTCEMIVKSYIYSQLLIFMKNQDPNDWDSLEALDNAKGLVAGLHADLESGGAFMPLEELIEGLANACGWEPAALRIRREVR